VFKKYHPTTIDNFNNNCPTPMIFGNKYAIEWWFNFPHRLFNVQTLPCETLKTLKT